MGTQRNAQGEVQLLAEWLQTLPPYFRTKTHMRVGSESLIYNGVAPENANPKLTQVWSDWADARVATGEEVWIVEACLVGESKKYGQVLEYCSQYIESKDYGGWYGQPIVPIVLCAAAKPRAQTFWARFGIRTIIFTPSWSRLAIQKRVFGASEAA